MSRADIKPERLAVGHRTVLPNPFDKLQCDIDKLTRENADRLALKSCVVTTLVSVTW